MSVRDARAPGVALAGVAVVGLLVGGVVFRNALDDSSGHAVLKPALAGNAPRWHDGYNHFILTVAVPLSPVAGRILAQSQDQRGDRRPAATQAAVGPGPAVKAAQLSVALERAKATNLGVATAAKRSASHSVTGPSAAAPGAPAGGAGYSLPWQAVPPNPADPIVLRAGQPVSLLAKALAGFPKGTTLERDSEGNIRAVLPPGYHWAPAKNGKRPAPATGHAPAPRRGSHPAQPLTPALPGRLPPGWLPDAKAVVASLLKLPGVHTASPVWGTRYQVATTLTAAQLRSVAGIGAVAPNNLFSYASLPATNDPDLADEYYVANDGQSVEGETGTTNASGNFAYAWARSRGSGVVVADIDTGVDEDNPDLSGQILPSSEDFAVSPPSSDVQANGTATGFYHATTVDGVLAGAAGNGWGGAGGAPEAKILALKCGDTDSLTDSCIYAAGEYAISQHVQILNMSFGEQVSSDPTLASLISDTQSAGILVAAAAGNWGTDNDTSAVLPAGYSTTYSNVISVGATDNQDNMAPYSDYGRTTVDLMAPGSDMFTDYPTYTGFDNAYVSGTSYSTPLVAAAAALIWSVDPGLSYTAVKNDILGTVNTTINPGLSSDCVTGGVLDAEAALAEVTEPVQFSFTGFDQVQPETAASVSINASAQAGALPTGVPLGYHLELVYNYSGTMYHVVGQTLHWTMGASGTQSVQTANDGTVFIAPSGINSTNYGANPLDLAVPSPGLPAGTYALVAYAATVAAPTTPIGNQQAVFFNVGQPSSTPAVTTTTTSGGGGGGATTTTSSSGSTTTTTGSGGGTTTTGVPSTTLGTGSLPGVGGGSSTSQPTTTTTTGSGTTTTTATTVPTGTTTTTAPGSGTTTTTSGSGTTTTTSGGSGTTTTTSGSGTTTTTSGGSGTTTTTSGGSGTTTTVPGTTTTTATGPTTSTSAAFTIDSVTPNQLPASGGDVSIFGNNLPSNPTVTVGAVDAAISNASSTEIDIMVSAMTPGDYSVTVYNADQSQSATLPDALTIGTPGTTTTTSGGGTTTTTGAGGATTTTTAGSGATTTTSAGGATTTTTSGGATTTTGSTTTTAATTTTTGATTTTTGPGGTIAGPDGMLLAPVPSSDAISNVPVGEWPAFTASQIIADNQASAGSAVDGVDV